MANKIHSLSGATPRFILGKLIEEIDEIESVVVFTKRKNGEIVGSASDSCEIRDLAYFALQLQKYFDEIS